MLKRGLFYAVLSVSAVFAMCGCGKEKLSPDDTGQKLEIVATETEVPIENTQPPESIVTPENIDEGNEGKGAGGSGAEGSGGNSGSGSESGQQEPAETPEVAKSSGSSADTVAKFDCRELKFTLKISEEMRDTVERMKYECFMGEHNEILNTDCDRCEFYIMFGKTKQIMFTVLAASGLHEAEELYELDSDFVRVGYERSRDVTYIVQFPSAPSEKLTAEEKKEYESLMYGMMYDISVNIAY